MEEIKILFFVVSTFFGVDQNRIISEKTTVTIDPEEKTISIQHQNLITFAENASDSLKVQSELKKITQGNHPWSSALENFSKKTKNFYLSKNAEYLNSELTLSFSNTNDLKIFGIYKNKEGKFSMTNFPKSHIKSTDGELIGSYWNFDANKPFTFTEAPLTDLPEEFQNTKTSLLPFWQGSKTGIKKSLQIAPYITVSNHIKHKKDHLPMVSFNL